MPLLKREPFRRTKPPSGLKPDEQVYYCKLTGEIFNDYEKFFERVILCNSLVWSCSATGKSGLTFQEALECERNARRQLDNFPEVLQRSILFLAQLTHRSRLSDVIDDIFLYAKDHYFVGETVEATIGETTTKKLCEIVKVISSSANGLSNLMANGESSSDSSDVICLDDVLQPEAKKPRLSEESSALKSPNKAVDSGTYDYVLQEVKSSTAIYVMPAQKISRKKGVLTRDKCKIFLRQHCEADVDGIWKVKSKSERSFKLSTVTFDTISSGPLPTFAVSEAKKKPVQKANNATSSNVIDLTSDDEGKEGKEKKAKPKKTKDTEKEKNDKEKKRKEKLMEEAKLHEAEKERLKKLKQKKADEKLEEELRQIRQAAAERNQAREKEKQARLDAKLAKKEELKQKAKEEREKKKEERDKQREEQRKQELYMLEWNRARDDLECDDLKNLPTPTPVQCAFPSELFGDAIFMLEYLSSFKSLFDLDLPKDLTFDSFGKALCDSEVDGLFSNVVCSLLMAIFRLQEEELNDDVNDDKDAKYVPSMDECRDGSLKELVKAATAASQLSMLNYGSSVRSLQLDNYTVSEILRLHLLASGSSSLANLKFDYQQRGAYTSFDDPGLDFRRQETTTLCDLAVKNIFDLAPEEKIKILMVLGHQLLTYAESRDFVEDNLEKLKVAQRNLRNHQLATQKRERDETQYWLKKKQDDKLKGIDSQGVNGEVSGADGKSSTEADKVDGVQETKKGRSKKSIELSDKDFENLPCENLDWEKISTDERLQMKAWEQRKEREFAEEVAEIQQYHSIFPIGLDRTYRRFWIFRSIPGLFVEDQDDHVTDDILIPVAQVYNNELKVSNGETSKQKDNSLEDSTSEGEKSSASDKENVPVDGIDGNRNVTLIDDDSQLKFTSVHEQISHRGQVRWAFYSQPEEIDSLILALNPRGYREGPLKSVISEQRDRLIQSIKSGDFAGIRSTSSEINPVSLDKRGKIRSKGTLPVVSKFATAHENMVNSLQEMFLDMEARIYDGTLGALKSVEDRWRWRQAMEECDYEQLNSSLPPNYKKESQSNSTDLDRKNTPPVVRELAGALLQIGQMVDQRYLKSPLGEESNSKKSKQKANHDLVNHSKKDKDSKKKDDCPDSDDDSSSTCSSSTRHKSAFERWEDSLMSSTSLPQLFLHMSILESSVAWSKSALHARCRICRRKGDGNQMLLCDGCDRGHHMYCLKPKVKHVPEGDWFCPTCRPKEVAHAPRTPRKNFVEASEDEEEEEEEEEGSDQEVEEEEDEEAGSDEEVEEEEEAGSDQEVEDENDDTLISANDDEDEEEEEESNENTAESSSEEEENETEDNSIATEEDEEETTPAPAKIKFSRAGKKPAAPAQPRGGSAKSRGASLERSNGRGASSRKSTEPRSAPRARGKRSLETKLNFSEDEELPGRKRKAPSDFNYDKSDIKRMSLSTKSRANDSVVQMKACEDLVAEVMQRDDAWPFLKPVTKRDAPDYFVVIKTPMDFSRIRNKINSFEYKEPHEVVEDVRLIFSNCRQYNMPTTTQYIAGEKLSRYFERRLRELKILATPANNKEAVSSRGRKLQTARKRTM